MSKNFSNNVTICGRVESARETNSRIGPSDVKAVVARINTGHGTVNCWATGDTGKTILDAYKKQQNVELSGFLRNGKESHYYVRTTYATPSEKQNNVSHVTALAKLNSVNPVGDGKIYLVETTNTSFLKSSQSTVKTCIKFIIEKKLGDQLKKAGIGSTIEIVGHFSSKKKGEKWFTNISVDSVDIVRIAQKTEKTEEQQQIQNSENELFNGKTVIQDFVSSIDDESSRVIQDAFRLRAVAESIKKTIKNSPQTNTSDILKMKDEATKKLLEAAKMERNWIESFCSQISLIANHYTQKAVNDGTVKDTVSTVAFKNFFRKRLDIEGYLIPHYCSPDAKKRATFDDLYEDSKNVFIKSRLAIAKQTATQAEEQEEQNIAR